jgi:hypothetical protein
VTVSLAEHDNVVEAFPADRTDQCGLTPNQMGGLTMSVIR